MKTLISKLCLLVSGVLMWGCQTDDCHQATLNTREVFFDATLASITPDVNDSTTFYIGTEDGSVFVYNSEQGIQARWETDFDRVYTIVPASSGNSDSLYWVGTRNMGLYRCKLINGHLSKENGSQRYYLPVAAKRSKYSAYDLVLRPTGIYVATSHGLFKLPAHSSDSVLHYLEPHLQRSNIDCLPPNVVGNIVSYGNRYLFCSSDDGVLRVDLHSDRLSRFLSGRKINNLQLRKGNICALTGDSLLMIDYEGVEGESLSLPKPAQFYYYYEASGVNYFLSSRQVQLVEDAGLYSPHSYKTVQLRHKLRTDCHHPMVSDHLHSQSLLVSNRSLLQVGHHQDVFNATGNVQYVCADEGYIYFLAGSQLYRMLPDERVAVRHKDLACGAGEVTFMEINQGVLYYVDSDNEFYKATLYDSYILNSIFSWDSHVAQSSEAKRIVTAIGKDKHNIYIGVRDDFRNVDAVDVSVELKNEAGLRPIDYPYVTAMYRHPVSGITLLGSLNDGLFMGMDNEFCRMHNTDTLPFVRDLAVVPGLADSLLVLTNRYLYKQSGQGFKVMADAQGYSRILVADSSHVYGVSNYGLRDLIRQIDYFTDIQFNPKACLVKDGKVYAGSSNGVYVFRNTLYRSDGKETGSYRIDFEETSYFSRTNLLILVFTLLTIILLLWWYDRHRIYIHTFHTIQESLLSRLDVLASVRAHLTPADEAVLNELMKQAKCVDTHRRQEALKRYRAINMEVMQLTGTVTLALVAKLIRQKEQIEVMLHQSAYVSELVNAAGCVHLNQIELALKTNELDMLAKSIEANEAWLEQTQQQLALSSEVNQIYQGLVSVFQLPVPITNPAGEEQTYEVCCAQKEALEHYMNQEDVKQLIDRFMVSRVQRGSALLQERPIVFDSIQSDKSLSELSPKVANLLQTLIEYYAEKGDLLHVKEKRAQTLAQLVIVERSLGIVENLVSLVFYLSPYVTEWYPHYKERIKELDEQELKAQVAAVKVNGKSADAMQTELQKQREELLLEIQEKSKPILDAIDQFYTAVEQTTDQELLNLLGYRKRKKTDGGQFLQGSVFVLLLARTDIPVSQFKPLLMANDQSLRRVKREILKQVDEKQMQIRQFAEQHLVSIADLVVGLIKEKDTL